MDVLDFEHHFLSLIRTPFTHAGEFLKHGENAPARCIEVQAEKHPG